MILVFMIFDVNRCILMSLSHSLSPYNIEFDQHNRGAKSCDDEVTSTQEFVPLGAIALFATSCTDYQENVNAVIAKANNIYADFLKSDEGRGFMGQVCIQPITCKPCHAVLL